MLITSVGRERVGGLRVAVDEKGRIKSAARVFVALIPLQHNAALFFLVRKTAAGLTGFSELSAIGRRLVSCCDLLALFRVDASVEQELEGRLSLEFAL